MRVASFFSFWSRRATNQMKKNTRFNASRGKYSRLRNLILCRLRRVMVINYKIALFGNYKLAKTLEISRFRFEMYLRRVERIALAKYRLEIFEEVSENVRPGTSCNKSSESEKLSAISNHQIDLLSELQLAENDLIEFLRMESYHAAQEKHRDNMAGRITFAPQIAKRENYWVKVRREQEKEMTKAPENIFERTGQCENNSELVLFSCWASCILLPLFSSAETRRSSPFFSHTRRINNREADEQHRKVTAKISKYYVNGTNPDLVIPEARLSARFESYIFVTVLESFDGQRFMTIREGPEVNLNDSKSVKLTPKSAELFRFPLENRNMKLFEIEDSARTREGILVVPEKEIFPYNFTIHFEDFHCYVDEKVLDLYNHVLGELKTLRSAPRNWLETRRRSWFLWFKADPQRKAELSERRAKVFRMYFGVPDVAKYWRKEAKDKFIRSVGIQVHSREDESREDLVAGRTCNQNVHNKVATGEIARESELYTKAMAEGAVADI